MPLSTDNPQFTILTLHDAVTDSPVYRSASIHFDNQVDLLEKWLDSLSKYMKQYVDKLNKFNFETNVLCKKVIPVGLDDVMIDPNFTGGVIKSFSDALQTSLAFKTKLVSDLEDNFIQPLQIFIKTHLKEFKDFRKQYEKILEKYDSQLVKYTSQSKSKEASAVREEAFRLYEARKSYVRMSGQHVIRILYFRSIVEHFLVERFTLATASHLKEFEGDAKSWSKLQSNLFSWKQWLTDDKETCAFQLNQLQQSRMTLERKFLANCRPVRDLENYNINSSQVNISSRHSLDFSNVATTNQLSHKWGYLFVRGARNYWTRRWFFLYDGCFGSCTPSTKSKGSVTLNDRVSVLLCDIKPMPDIDRRNCFEVMCAQQPPYILQAETENEMREWISAFEKAKRLMLQNTQSVNEEPPSKPTTEDVPALNTPVTEQPKEKPSIVMLSSTPENDQKSLTRSTSMTPLLVWEASRAALTTATSTSTPTSPATQSFSQAALSLDAAAAEDSSSTTTTSTWGIPWALVPSMFQGGSTDDIKSELPPTPGSPNAPSVIDADGHQIIWPTRVDDSNAPKVNINGYLPQLDISNKELRHLFGGVDPKEVVLFDFVGLLKKKPLNEASNDDDNEAPASPTLSNQSVDVMEQELRLQLPDTIKEPTSNFGYGYTGRGFVTQDTFWFYSCVLMHCVNTVAIRLNDIKSVRLIRDPSIVNTGSVSNLALAIDLTGSDGTDPLIITALMENIEVIAERLKFAVSNAKQKEPEPLQTTYDVIHSLSVKSKPYQAKTIVKSATEPTPIKVEVNPSSSTASTHSVSSSTNNSTSSLLLDTPLPTKSSDIKKKLSPRKFSAPVQPKSGALAAAVMAASVAGGFDARKAIESQQQQQQQQYKKEEVPPVPTPSKLIESTTANDIEKVNNDNPHALPSDMEAPSGPVSCDCDNHLDKLEAEIELPISAKHLYYIMFDESNPSYMDIWEQKTVENKSKQLTMTSWQMVEGKQERTLRYIIPVNNAMVKLKEAEVVEKQIIEKKQDYLRYVVLTSTKTAQLPYADAFVPYVKYCITWVSQDQCKLSCYTGVKFLKNILVKGMVNKAAMKGMAENIAVFMPIVKKIANKQSSKKSKDKTSKQEEEIEKPAKEIEAATVENKQWYEPYVSMAQDLLSDIPLFAKVSVATIIFLWFMYTWLRSGSQKQNLNTSSPLPDQAVVSRAVYLRDIDEGLINVQYRPSYIESESFRSFKESKSTNSTLGSTRKWYSSHHHQFAVELLFSRERLAMLRHNTLVLFQLVNEVDAQLLENEYTNWLMDTRLQCRSPNVDYTALHCDEVKRQLKSFPIVNNFDPK